jgi:hypothetical protein
LPHDDALPHDNCQNLRIFRMQRLFQSLALRRITYVRYMGLHPGRVLYLSYHDTGSNSSTATANDSNPAPDHNCDNYHHSNNNHYHDNHYHDNHYHDNHYHDNHYRDNHYDRSLWQLHMP